MADSKGSGGAVTVAVIGVVGVLGAALIAKMWPAPAPPPPPPINIYVPSVPGGNIVKPKRIDPTPTPPTSPSETTPPPPVMEQLQMGINLQGDDYDNTGRIMANAEACAEACRTDSNCKAMTYVNPGQHCWLKSAVPAALKNPYMISSIKHVYASAG